MKPAKIQDSPIGRAKQNYEAKIGSKFTPSNETYQKLSINPKRLGMLISGRNCKDITLKEAISISQLFGVLVTDLA